MQINSAGMIPPSNNPAPPHHDAHTERPAGKAHSESSACARTGSKEHVWDRGENFNISECQETEPLQLTGSREPHGQM